jgi:hypothetical protein
MADPRASSLVSPFLLQAADGFNHDSSRLHAGNRQDVWSWPMGIGRAEERIYWRSMVCLPYSSSELQRLAGSGVWPAAIVMMEGRTGQD